MAIVVGTNSYVTEAELNTYAFDREITISGTAATLLIKAMDYLETRNWKGIKYESDQALEWPRNLGSMSAYDSYYVDPAVVPDDIETAQIIAALLIDSGEDLMPNVGRSTKREKVDVIEVEYMDTAASTTQYSQLSALITPYTQSTNRVTRA
jgi:hypothetical protein